MANINNKNNVFIHIGLHKTGTTFLQKVVFPTLQDVHLVKPWARVRKVLLVPTDHTLLISNEALGGIPWNGTWYKEFEENVEMIKNRFPEASILIGFRRHESLLLSLYKQYLQEGGATSIQKFINDKIIDIENFHFGKRISYIEKRFDNIFIYTQEEMINRFESFFSSLCHFFETEPTVDEPLGRETCNVGLRGEMQSDVLIALNRIDRLLARLPVVPTLNNSIFRRFNITPRHICQHWLSGISSSPLRLPEGLRDKVRTRFEEDWSHVQKCLEARP